jgi:ferrochelatase
MRYGQPSIAGVVLDQFKHDGVERVLVVPLYPQFAASSTASVMDDVADWIKRSRNPLEFRFIKHFHDHPGYIAAWPPSVKEHWAIQRPAGHAGDELPRPAAPLARPGRPLLLRVPEDRTPAGRSAGT